VSEVDHWLRAGAVGRPHGLDGSFHVGNAVPGLLELGRDVQVAGAARRIDRLAGHERRLIMRLEGCDRRRDAEALRGQEILVPRSYAPELEEDEWWADDLEGCLVRDGQTEVGVVARLLGLPSCEVLEVTREGDPPRPNLLVPLIKDAVRAVDVQARVIDIDLAFLGEV
jgi:16S rRNA processing protein RimM